MGENSGYINKKKEGYRISSGFLPILPHSIYNINQFLLVYRTASYQTFFLLNLHRNV